MSHDLKLWSAYAFMSEKERKKFQQKGKKIIKKKKEKKKKVKTIFILLD